MTTKEARLELEQANTCVRKVFENALEMKAAASEIPVSLQQIAECLNNVVAEPIQGDLTILAPDIELLRSRMRQIQMLLDSAAAFYCGSISKARSIDTESYTASGARTARADIHQLHIEA